MAKAGGGRRSGSQLLRLQRFAALARIASLCAISLVVSAFTPSNWNGLQRAGAARSLIAKASDGDRVCRSSKSGRLRHASRQPKRKQHLIQRRLAPLSPLSLPGSRESQVSK
jgi:hypothetical protein